METTDRNQALSAAIAAFFEAAPPQCPTKTQLYNIAAQFAGDGGPYWLYAVRGDRFTSTIQHGILFRPSITQEICAEIDSALGGPTRRGVMLKGPQGIGKSHSLVNTVLSLESTGNYLVTFIPDCSIWVHGGQLVDWICGSFHSSPQALGLRMGYVRVETLCNLIDDIDSILKVLNKKWVFVFDQVNKLFSKTVNAQVVDASGLAFPFHTIQTVLKAGRITSVISASANNEISYKDQHEDFNEYYHKTNMSCDELCLTFDGINAMNVGNIVKYSGGVPLYSKLYLKNPNTFQKEVNASVRQSIDRLSPKSPYQEPDWNLVLDSIFSSLLATESGSPKFDRKFVLRESADEVNETYRYYPVFPAVLSSYRRILWHQLMKYVQLEEQNLLSVCCSYETSNYTRGRLFETIVIRRFQSRGINIQVGGYEVDIRASAVRFPEKFRFQGRLLPQLTKISEDGVYIPYDPNFPAIDVVWKHGRSVFGVQVHVSKHEDVASSFLGLCSEAGWFRNFDKVYLLYLGPEDAVTDLVSKLTEPPTFGGRSTRSTDCDETVHRRAISKDSISCLVDLQWPDGCSLRPKSGAHCEHSQAMDLA
jgi:hypothetical protein